MKKLISMFAFAAMIVFTAVAIVSCDRKEENPLNAKHKFTFTLEVSSSTESSQEFIREYNQKQAAQFNENAKTKALTATEADASILWMQMLNEPEYSTDIQNIANELGKILDDTHVTVTLKMIEDGTHVFQTKTYLTRYFFGL